MCEVISHECEKFFRFFAKLWPAEPCSPERFNGLKLLMVDGIRVWLAEHIGCTGTITRCSTLRAAALDTGAMLMRQLKIQV